MIAASAAPSAERQRIEIGLAQFGIGQPALRQLGAREPQHLGAAIDPQRMFRAAGRTVRASARCRCRYRPAARSAPRPAPRPSPSRPRFRRYGAIGSHPIPRHWPRTSSRPTPPDRRAPPRAAPRRPPPNDRGSIAGPVVERRDDAARPAPPRRAPRTPSCPPCAARPARRRTGSSHGARRAAGSARAPARVRRPTAPSSAAAPGCEAASDRPGRERYRERASLHIEI